MLHGFESMLRAADVSADLCMCCMGLNVLLLFVACVLHWFSKFANICIGFAWFLCVVIICMWFAKLFHIILTLVLAYVHICSTVA